MAHEDEELSPELRALFDNYPRPTGNAAFDARFWRELDARQTRYRGCGGLVRRLVEIEIEGIAVWRLGFSLFGGAAACALGVALLSLGVAPTHQAPPQIARTEQIPTALPRYAREMVAVFLRLGKHECRRCRVMRAKWTRGSCARNQRLSRACP